MLHYAVVFFVIALIAAVLGFRGVAGMSAQIGWLFAVIAVIFLAVAMLTGRGPKHHLGRSLRTVLCLSQRVWQIIVAWANRIVYQKSLRRFLLQPAEAVTTRKKL